MSWDYSGTLDALKLKMWWQFQNPHWKGRGLTVRKETLVGGLTNLRILQNEIPSVTNSKSRRAAGLTNCKACQFFLWQGPKNVTKMKIFIPNRSLPDDHGEEGVWLSVELISVEFLKHRQCQHLYEYICREYCRTCVLLPLFNMNAKLYRASIETN